MRDAFAAVRAHHDEIRFAARGVLDNRQRRRTNQ
jgi:hypothetical protein